MDSVIKGIQNGNKWEIKDAMTTNRESAKDSYSANIHNRNELRNLNCRIVPGYVLDTCPVTHAYKVSIAGGFKPVTCCSLQIGGNPVLSHDCNSYAPGSYVLVALHPAGNIILGTIPLSGSGNDLIVHNKLSAFSKNYPDVSDLSCLQLITKDKPEVGMRDFGHGLPIDTTDIGEFGHITATGVKLSINPFMALMGTDDYTGLWLFQEDSLARLSGINLQVRSSGREEEFLNDNGEYIEYRGSVLYPWEQLGYTKVPTSDLIELPPKEEYKYPNTWKAFAEPYEEKAKPFHRIVDYGGWLGQGKFTQIVAPDPDKDWIVFEEKENYPGLHRQVESVDGIFSSISSCGTYINKRGLIPSVSRKTRPDDTSTKVGDNETNYKKTNSFTAKTEIPSSDQPMERVMGLQDSLAYQQNFKELLPFLQHKEDYHVPEDSELNGGYSRFANVSELSSKQLISVNNNQHTKITYGDNDREAEVNSAESGIACLSDGSEVLYGGCGEEIRMAGGSIFMDAPGDLWFKSGRKIILWAGDDIEIRAKGHIDVSTTEGSVRIKAESKLSMLGGNNEKDGVLIESRGKSSTYNFEGGERDQFGGIILKSKGTIGALGSTIYLRSGTDDEGDGIFLDANRGGHSIYTMCNSNVNYLESSFEMNFSNMKTGDIDTTNSFTKDNTILSGNITVNGVAQIMGDITTGSSIFAVGHINTGGAKGNGGHVGELNRDELKRDMQEQEDSIEQSTDNASESYRANITEGLSSEGGIANENTLKNAGFSFRQSDEYNLPEDFAVYESRWQNIATNANQGIVEWKEKAVKSPSSEPTYPFPGKEAFTETSCYITQSWTLTDYYTGLYKDRWKDDDATDEYKDPKFGEQQRKILDQYPVI